MNDRRRRFLRRLAGAGAAAAGAGALADLGLLSAASVLNPAFAQTADYRALVCVFLFGGNDANNMVVSLDAGAYSLYTRARQGLALPAAALLQIQPANPGAPAYGLHPAMGGMQRLFAEGRAAVVANVGPLVAPVTAAQYRAGGASLPVNLFSHSDQQSQWQSSISDGSGRSGWAGRIADLVQSANTNRGATCISLSGNNLWQNGTTLVSYKVAPSGNFGFDFYDPASRDPVSTAVTEVLRTARSNLFEQAWLDVMQRALDNQRALSDALASTPFTTGFPDTDLGQQLRMAARLIAARGALGMRRQTFFCALGGFDTHGDDQLQRQQQLLGDLSAAVSAFYDATVQMGVASNVTTFTASDFGRTLASNGQGSDHGWGAHHIVVGGGVRGGTFYGTFPSLAIGGADDAGDGRWIPTTAVDQYAASMARWFGVAAGDMATVFPNLGRFAAADLGFMA